MYKVLLVVLLTPAVIFGQRKKEKLFLTGDFKIKALTKKPNYIDERARISLVRYLIKRDLKPENYFIDSAIHYRQDTLIINVWDVTGLETIRKNQRLNDSLRKMNSILKYPKPVGNPGNCFTAYYSQSRKEIIAIDVWQ